MCSCTETKFFLPTFKILLRIKILSSVCSLVDNELRKSGNQCLTRSKFLNWLGYNSRKHLNHFNILWKITLTMNRLWSWKWLLSNAETTIWHSSGLSFTGLVSNLCNEDFAFCFTFPECVSYPVMFLSLWIWGMKTYWSKRQSR